MYSYWKHQATSPNQMHLNMRQEWSIHPVLISVVIEVNIILGMWIYFWHLLRQETSMIHSAGLNKYRSSHNINTKVLLLTVTLI